MQIIKYTEEKITPKYLTIAVPVEDDEIPYDLPHRQLSWWEITIDLQTNRIQNYRYHKDVSIHIKVVDQGFYCLLDSDKNIICALENEYVPSGLGEYGDYLVFNISSDGCVFGPKYNPNLFVKEFQEFLDKQRNE